MEIGIEKTGQKFCVVKDGVVIANGVTFSDALEIVSQETKKEGFLPSKPDAYDDMNY